MAGPSALGGAAWAAGRGAGAAWLGGWVEAGHGGKGVLLQAASSMLAAKAAQLAWWERGKAVRKVCMVSRGKKWVSMGPRAQCRPCSAPAAHGCGQGRAAVCAVACLKR